jgi:dTDP-4-dehydrorhamnose 3,5-epimerase
VRIIGTQFAGAFIIEPEKHEDARGFFARTFCAREFGERGLAANFVQCSVSLSHKRGTLRGLHCQRPPACEVKLVRCTAGALWDVIVDLRQGSPTYLQHLGVELTARNRRAIYVPEMFAHGSQALEENTEIFYQISEFHAPEAAFGLRYNDPKLGIQWPLPVVAVSEKDANWPLLG